MRKLALVAVLCVFVLMQRPAHAQQFDAAFGFGGLTSPAGTTDSSGTFFPSIRGGLYPSFSADVLIKHHLGVQGEFAWRARQNLYGGYQPYRPIFYDFNGIFAPQLGKKFGAELMAGIGGEDVRFYTGQYTCSFVSCTNYVSSNHFMGHVGAGLRYYVWGNVFVRPEANFYFVHNNNEFSSGRIARYGVSIGYSFRSGF
ncbi:MAG: hypothetical protein ACRD2U_01355 [Terriglobales bacterium]